jgi:hypothetical protein
MVCLRNICINTLHKGAKDDGDDDDADDDDDANNNNNNNCRCSLPCGSLSRYFPKKNYLPVFYLPSHKPPQSSSPC